MEISSVRLIWAISWATRWATGAREVTHGHEALAARLAATEAWLVRAPPARFRPRTEQPAPGRWHNALVTQNQSVDQRIADQLGVAVRQVSAAVGLLDGGATVPFIARYRKEATGGLDDAQLRTLDERLRYLRELDERRDAIRKEIESQGKLTDRLAAQLR